MGNENPALYTSASDFSSVLRQIEKKETIAKVSELNSSPCFLPFPSFTRPTVYVSKSRVKIVLLLSMVLNKVQSRPFQVARHDRLSISFQPFSYRITLFSLLSKSCMPKLGRIQCFVVMSRSQHDCVL